MLKQKNNIIYGMIPLLVLIFGCVLLVSMGSSPRNDMAGSNAVWDLQQEDLFENRFRIIGEVEYIPNALLTPEEFEQREREVVLGQPEKGYQYATSRMTILLPDDNYYAFTRRSVDYAHRVYANGVLVSEIGTPGETRETMTPDTGHVTVMLKPENGVITLVQQASVFVHRAGDTHTMWTISEGSELRSELRWDLFDALYMGSFLMLFFVHTILFLLLRSYRANLFFALFCLTWFFRMGVTGAKLLTDFAPWLSWVVKFRMEYLALPITGIFLISLIHEIFPGVMQKWFLKVHYGWSGLFGLLCLFTDTVILSRLMIVCQVMYLFVIVYILIRFVIKQRSLSPEQGIFLVGVVIFFLASAYDIFFYMIIRVYATTDLSQLAMLLLALCEAAAMFISTVRQIENAKVEEQRLAVENAALDRINRMRSSMMATMGHEMRTPLTVMSVYAQLASENLQELSIDQQTTADLKMISKEAKRLAEMATGLLIINQEQEKQKDFELVDLAALIKQMAGLCQSMLDKNGNRLELRISDDLPKFNANVGECTQLLWNLLSNAAQHTKDGIVAVNGVKEQDAIVLTVTDSGEGISEELLSHVFERGVSGREERSGLGIAICKEIVDSHGGSMSIECPKQGGTVVTVTLPFKNRGID